MSVGQRTLEVVRVDEPICREWKMVTIAFEILVCSHNVFLPHSAFLLLVKNRSIYPEKVEQSNDCQRQDSVAFAKDSQTKSEVGERLRKKWF